MKKLFSIVLICGLALGQWFSLFTSPAQAQTVSLASLNHIIPDAHFFNGGDMSAGSIQEFLQRKGSYLATWIDPLTQLRPAQIIDMVSRQYNISAKTILVTLQKEQSLIEHGGGIPSDDALDWAMGYAICDSCSKSDPALQDFRGFFNQVKYATAIFDKYRREINQSGQTRAGFGPGISSIVDGSVVVPQNVATAALLTYTPHEHGNQNFYKIWQKWFKSIRPDGSLLQVIGQPGIYLVQDGQVRGFASLSALLTRGYDLDHVIGVTTEELAQYTVGVPIQYPQYALLQAPDGTRYMLVDDLKRKIDSPEVFKELGFNPEEVEEVPQSVIDSFADGQPLTMIDVYPTGALLQNKDTGSVYFVQAGLRQPVIDRSLLELRFGKDAPLISVDSAKLKSYAIGTPVILHDGQLVKSDTTPAVYVISNGQRRPFVSAAAFEQLGYLWENIVSVPETVLALHSLGDPILVE